MTGPITLNIDGPHSPELTREAASLIAQAARFLNHATGNHAASALEYPSDVDSVIGSLEALAAMLPQLHGQLLAWLQDRSRDGKVRIDNGGDPATAVTEVCMALLDASGAAGRLQDAYALARRFTNTMGAPYGPAEDPDA